MSDYGLFDDVVEAEAKLTRQASAEADKVTEAVYEAKKRYASFVAGAKDDEEFKTRLAFLGNDVHTLVAEYTTPTPAVMRKVRAALKPTFASPWDKISDEADADSGAADHLDTVEAHQKAMKSHGRAMNGAPNNDAANSHMRMISYHEKAIKRLRSKTSSVKTAWAYDPKDKTYTATGLDSIAFSCPNCSDLHEELGYNRCKCGKVWNSYAIKSGDKVANGTTLICREVNERDTKLAATQKEKEGYEHVNEAANYMSTKAWDADQNDPKRPGYHQEAASRHNDAAAEHTKAAKQAPTEALKKVHEGMAEQHKLNADTAKKDTKTSSIWKNDLTPAVHTYSDDKYPVHSVVVSRAERDHSWLVSAPKEAGGEVAGVEESLSKAKSSALRHHRRAVHWMRQDDPGKTSSALDDAADFDGSGKYRNANNVAERLSLKAHMSNKPEDHNAAMKAHKDAMALTTSPSVKSEHERKAQQHLREVNKIKSSSVSNDADFELGWNTAKAGIELPSKEASVSRDWYEGYIAQLQSIAAPTSDPDGYIIPGEAESDPQDPDEWKKEQEDYAEVADKNNNVKRDEEPAQEVPFKDKKSALSDKPSYEDAAHEAALATRNALRSNQTRPVTSHERAYGAHLWAASVAPDQESHGYHSNMANWHENMSADADGAWGAKPGKMPEKKK